MSTGPDTETQVAEQNAKRAAQYAEEAAAAIHRVRIVLNYAAGAAQEGDLMLGRGRGASSDLTTSGELMSRSDEPRRHLLDAESYSGETGQRVGTGGDILRDVRENLERGRGHLRAGRQAVVQLSRLPGQGSELANNLHDRLDRLEAVVHHADQRAVEVAAKLAVAQGNVEPMLAQARFGDLQVTADTVRATGTHTRRNLEAAQEDLDGLRRDIDGISPELAKAERESSELEMHARAAMNPTPPTQRAEPGSAAAGREDTFNLRPGQSSDRQNTFGR